MKSVYNPSGPRATTRRPVEDFDHEGRALLARLNIPHDGGRLCGDSCYNPLDCVYRHPSSGGALFIGNLQAASGLAMLQSLGVRRVVNCIATGPGASFQHEAAGVAYMRFNVANWQDGLADVANPGAREDHLREHPESVSPVPLGAALRFFEPFLAWVDDGLAAGDGVLIHCLVGAHRAGTSGVAYCMHAGGLRLLETLLTVKRLRPAVDPFGTLMEALRCLEADMFPESQAEPEERAVTLARESEELLAKYVDMRRKGVPEGAVLLKIKKDSVGNTEEMLAAFLAATQL